MSNEESSDEFGEQPGRPGSAPPRRTEATWLPVDAVCGMQHPSRSYESRCLVPYREAHGEGAKPHQSLDVDGHTLEWVTGSTRQPVDVSDIHARLQEEAGGRATDIEATVAEITAWWAATAASDAATTAPKAAEYGAADLAIMGKAMESLFPGIEGSAPDERERIGLEMAIAFYTLGKVARLFGAYQQGRLPGDDSWFDLTVYPVMARRVRAVGRWV